MIKFLKNLFRKRIIVIKVGNENHPATKEGLLEVRKMVQDQIDENGLVAITGYMDIKILEI